TIMGMLVYVLKSAESNRLDDLSDNPGRWIAEGLDRSGIFSVAFEINNTFEKSFGLGAYGALMKAFPQASQQGTASRYAARSQAAAWTGPTGDLLDTAIHVAAALKSATIGDFDKNGELRRHGFTEGDVNSV